MKNMRDFCITIKKSSIMAIFLISKNMVKEFKLTFKVIKCGKVNFLMEEKLENSFLNAKLNNTLAIC